MSETSGTRRARGQYDHLAPLFERLATLAPDTPEREQLRDELVTEHLPVARNIAHRFRNRNESTDDLTQVASMGLVKAVDRFDPSHGSDFMSFAVPTIVGEVRKHFRETAWAMRVPRPLKERHASIGTASTELSQQLGRAPTPSELAEHLGISKAEVIEGLEVSSAQRSASLDELLTSETGTSLGDTLGDYDSDLAGVENREALRPLLATLSEREQAVISLRFFKNMTQTQIAEQIGVSQMHVSRLLAKTLAKLREGMSSN